MYNKKGFLTLFWWEDMISDLSRCFLNGQELGVKKASLYVHFEGLTTDSYFGKNKTPWGKLYNKKGFLTLFWWENMISDLSSCF